MKVFISWSGSLSKAIAELLDEWLQCVIQGATPWISTRDIDRGALWFSEISDILGDTRIGIICLTAENLNRPWILFEAGALAKGLTSSRVCTLLIDIEPKDVGNPLAQFNHTLTNKEGIYQLVATVNKLLGEGGLKPNVLHRVFETNWPQLAQGIKDAIKNNPREEKKIEKKGDNEMMADVLEAVRSIERRVRQLEPTQSGAPAVGYLAKTTAANILDEAWIANLGEFETTYMLSKRMNISKVESRLLMKQYCESRGVTFPRNPSQNDVPPADSNA